MKQLCYLTNQAACFDLRHEPQLIAEFNAIFITIATAKQLFEHNPFSLLKCDGTGVYTGLVDVPSSLFNDKDYVFIS